MSALCPLDDCARPTQDGGVCQQDTWRMRRDLEAVPELLDDLHTTLARQGKNGPATERVKGKGETPLTFHRNASEALAGLRGELVGWARQAGMPWCEYATTAAQHLLEHLYDLRIRGDAARLWDDLGDAFVRARHAVDAPADRARFPVGPCPEQTEGGAPCPGTVRAFIPADDRPGRMVCDADGEHSWGSVQWLRAGKRIRDLAERRARVRAAS